MGIRFLCRHCQRSLNVKQRLAGAYCFCPDCREEILIPQTSTIASSKKWPKRGGQGGDFESADAGKETAVLERPDRGSEAGEVSAAGGGAKRNVPEVAASLRAGDVSRKASVKAATFLRAQAVDRALPETNVATNLVDSDCEALGYIESGFHEESGLQGSAANHSLKDRLSANRSERPAPDSFLLSKPVAKIEDHPLQSNPNLIWYLRHRSLGEKGPLKTPQLEKMLETGQVRAGAILWRQDWNDWLPAEKVFPQIAMDTSNASYEIPDELNPHSEVNRKRRSRSRFWRGFNAAAFLLIIVLVYWLTQVIS